MKRILASKTTWIVVALVACVGSIGYWQRGPLEAWYHVRQLRSADEENREACAARVAALEEAALPRLLDGLYDADPEVCANLQMPLCMIAQRWGPHDPRSLRLAEQVHDQFNAFSPAGQEKAVGVLTSLVHLERRADGGAEMQENPPPSLPSKLTTLVGEVLMTAEQIDHLRPGALLLAAELIDGVQPGQWVDVGRDMAQRGMKDASPATRAAALHLLARKSMRGDEHLVEQGVALLQDPEASVRKAALVAMASEADAVRDEALLPLLHDSSDEVQYWCEIVLRKRGRTDGDIQRARMITDKNPATRLRVIFGLRSGQDINVGAWLMQLSHDPSPMVRAAAVRAAGDQPQVDFADRLREMAERDPSETVRQNARFYVQQRNPIGEP